MHGYLFLTNTFQLRVSMILILIASNSMNFWITDWLLKLAMTSIEKRKLLEWIIEIYLLKKSGSFYKKKIRFNWPFPRKPGHEMKKTWLKFHGVNLWRGNWNMRIRYSFLLCFVTWQGNMKRWEKIKIRVLIFICILLRGFFVVSLFS